jgi:NADH-quinone oxidoreductase subunit D
MNNVAMADRISTLWSEAKIKPIYDNQIEIINPPASIEGLLIILRSLGFSHLSSIYCRELPHQGFVIIFSLWCYSLNLHSIVKANIPKDKPDISSSSAIWKTASIYEFDIWKEFGIIFTGNTDITRLAFSGELNRDETCDYLPEPQLFIFGAQYGSLLSNFGYKIRTQGHTVISAEPERGYLARGIERIAGDTRWIAVTPLVSRICPPDSLHYEVLYSLAIERLCHIEVGEYVSIARTLLLEISRLSSFMAMIAALGYSLGLEEIMPRILSEREKISDFLEWISGARIFHNFSIPGGIRREFPMFFSEEFSRLLNEIEYNIMEWDGIIFENPTAHTRLKGFAVVNSEEAVNFGLSGINLRATGFASDIRIETPYCAYDMFDIEIPSNSGGNALSRAFQLRMEYEATIGLIRNIIKKFARMKPENYNLRETLPNPLKFQIPESDLILRVESAFGECGIYVASNGGETPVRLSFRSPSLPAALSLAKEKLPGINIEDLPLWCASFFICAADFEK